METYKTNRSFTVKSFQYNHNIPYLIQLCDNLSYRIQYSLYFKGTPSLHRINYNNIHIIALLKMLQKGGTLSTRYNHFIFKTWQKTILIILSFCFKMLRKESDTLSFCIASMEAY